jgi:hypothetical protein
MTLATRGRGSPIKNQGQNFLPKFFAINPVIKGNMKGMINIGIAKTTSIFYFFIVILKQRAAGATRCTLTIKP